MNRLYGKRILIVEDDITNMAVYAATLKRSGAVIIQDFWNDDTINMVKTRMPIDVILLDLMLHHQVSGYEIFDSLQSDPELAQIPVVAVSAADPAVEIPKTKARGFAGFISKPINAARFPHQITSCLNGEAVWYSQEAYLEDFK